MQENVKVKKGKKVLDFVIKTMNGMAYGLFSTLIVAPYLPIIPQWPPEFLFISSIAFLTCSLSKPKLLL